MKISIENLMGCPDFYPLHLDAAKHLISFVRMSADSYRASSFLDHRIITASPQTVSVNWDDLLLYEASIGGRTASAQYVLHTAFCCSTLLSRYLDLIPCSLVLREPYILTQLAASKLRISLSDDCVAADQQHENWNSLLHLCLRLLTRTYSTNKVIIIKASDLCNCLGNVLLNHDSSSKVLFLTIDLKTFLLSVLKAKERRVWVRTRNRTINNIATLFPAFANIDPEDLSDCEAAAYLWLLNQRICHALQAGRHSARVFVLDGERVVQEPQDTLAKVAHLFHLPSDEAVVSRAVEHWSMSRYSKNPSWRYDAKSRGSILKNAEDRHGNEVDSAIHWATRLQSSPVTVKETAFETLTGPYK